MKVTSTILLLVLCVLGFAYAQVDDTCPRTECAKGGEICGWIDCRGDSVCTFSGGSSTRDQTGICQIPAKLGDSCDNLDCESSLTCNNGVCALQNPLGSAYLYPGESCDYNTQCRYNSPYDGGDEENKCSSGKCKSVKNGDYCDESTGSREQCHYNNAYCGRKRMCEKYISDGGACFFDDETRYGCGKNDHRCMPNGYEREAGTCRRKHTQKENDFCINIDDCKEGLLCIYPTSSSVGICYKPESPTLDKLAPNTNVTDNYGCNSTNFETGLCHEDGTRYCHVNGLRYSGYHGAWWKFTECSRKHNCDYLGFSCIKEHCKSEQCNLYKVQRKAPYSSTECVAEGLCNSAFALVASPVLAFLAFIVVFAL